MGLENKQGMMMQVMHIELGDENDVSLSNLKLCIHPHCGKTHFVAKMPLYLLSTDLPCG